ncbi:MAG: hypothetical protein M3Q71_22290 [Chloroflexota bacterium]|nr:hypothetical protein [Chloroflexota bacterium]
MDAGREAGRKFEAENPPPVWQGAPSPVPGAHHRYNEPGLFRRVMDRVTGADGAEEPESLTGSVA